MTVAVEHRQGTRSVFSFQGFPKDGIVVVGLGNPHDPSVQYMELTRAEAMDALGVLATEIRFIDNSTEESK